MQYAYNDRISRSPIEPKHCPHHDHSKVHLRLRESDEAKRDDFEEVLDPLKTGESERIAIYAERRREKTYSAMRNRHFENHAQDEEAPKLSARSPLRVRTPI